MQTRAETQPSSTSEAPIDPILGAAVPGVERPDTQSFEPVRRRDRLLPGIVVAVVAAAGLGAALMTPRLNAPDPEAQQAQGGAVNPKNVVQAPPLTPPATATANREDKRPAQSMGAAAACENCGTVQMVVAVHGYAQTKASGYQMHIRMDDGSTRTVEQRGALPAGSRVVLKGDSLRALSQSPGQG